MGKGKWGEISFQHCPSLLRDIFIDTNESIGFRVEIHSEMKNSAGEIESQDIDGSVVIFFVSICGNTTIWALKLVYIFTIDSGFTWPRIRMLWLLEPSLRLIFLKSSLQNRSNFVVVGIPLGRFLKQTSPFVDRTLRSLWTPPLAPLRWSSISNFSVTSTSTYMI